MSCTMSTRSLTRSKSPGIARSIAPRLRQQRARGLEVAPHGRDEDRRVRVQGVAVGHAGDVVRDRALGAVGRGDPLVLWWEDLGMLLEVLEQREQHALGLAILGLRRASEVHVIEHELP